MGPPTTPGIFASYWNQHYCPLPQKQSEDQSEALDACWAAQYANDLNDCEFTEESLMKQNAANVDINRSSDIFSTNSKHDTVVEEPQSISCPPNGRWPLIPITNNRIATLAIGKPSPPLSNPPPPPVRLPPPPPAPPPPPPRPGVKTTRSSESANLKRSATISRLYMGMKEKVEGAASVYSTSADIAVQRRTMVEGMAEALAEITRKQASHVHPSMH